MWVEIWTFHDVDESEKGECKKCLFISLLVWLWVPIFWYFDSKSFCWPFFNHFLSLWKKSGYNYTKCGTTQKLPMAMMASIKSVGKLQTCIIEKNYIFDLEKYLFEEIKFNMNCVSVLVITPNYNRAFCI